MPRVHSTALALALLCCASAQAATADAPAAATHQFLDKSVVTIPTKLGDYSLARRDYDPQAFNVGVSTLWDIAGAPQDVTLNVYVYPLGRGEEGEVVAGQIGDVEAAVKEAEKEKLYTDVVVGARTPFVVVAGDASILDDGKKKAPAAFDPTPKPESDLHPTKDADPILAAIADSQPSPNSHGMREAFSFKREGVAMRSLGYVFYRHLYGFKVRISAPESAIDQAAFEALADQAARNIVPRIDVKNYGACGTIEVPVGDDKAKGKAAQDAESQQMAQVMIRGMMRIKRENCANDEGKKPDPIPEGSVRETIVYPAGTWKQG